MKLDEKILQEIQRYNSINKYVTEQEAEPPVATPPDAAAPPPDAAAPPPAEVPPAEPQVVDTATDPDVEKVDASGETESEETPTGDTEELDITDLVNSQKNVETKQEEYFTKLFSQLQNLELKLSEMDKIVSTLNDIENKIEKYRIKTPQEKLELRSLDSYPYNQKLSDFFMDKQDEIEKSGKNEYVLTTDEVEDFSPREIKNSFNEFDDVPQFPFRDLS